MSTENIVHGTPHVLLCGIRSSIGMSRPTIHDAGPRDFHNDDRPQLAEYLRENVMTRIESENSKPLEGN
jgi:hypothetical protein